jgi:D-3-phosphoglycerate dehydrogenase
VQLAGSSLGIIGYGSIGSHLARLGLALGMKVLVADPYKRVDEPGVEQADLPTLMQGSDFVVCLVIASPVTENLIDEAALAHMRPTAYFINASRGELVDEAALGRALESGRIAGAALDVGREGDQMPAPRLARLANVIATPHIGGLTPQAVEFQALGTVDQVREIIGGRVPPGALNAERATRLQRLGA